MATASEFKLGEKFSSFHDFESKLERHKSEKFVEMWTRVCRTIAAARKRGIDRPMKAELVYYQLKYCC
uniref:ZSWIM3 N-terminal domain-containing protein n=1 Tax=Amphimedon queenslandica TaxID=400682 RepID=A0A1X7TD69_AMPQE